jgi:hypothetical protein
MRRMVSHESVERSGVKRQAPISHPGGLIACGSLLQWTKENAGNLFGNVLLAQLPGCTDRHHWRRFRRAFRALHGVE